MSGQRKIVCLETGWVFDSLKQCAKYIGITPRGLARHLNGHASRMATNGFTLVRVGKSK